MDKYGGHPWEGGASFAQIPQDSSRETLFSQYERHTRHCPKCMTVNSCSSSTGPSSPVGLRGIATMKTFALGTDCDR